MTSLMYVKNYTVEFSLLTIYIDKIRNPKFRIIVIYFFVLYFICLIEINIHLECMKD